MKHDAADSKPRSKDSPHKLKASSFLIALIPAVIFWLLESKAELVTALLAAMTFGVVQLGYMYWKHRRFELMTLISTALVLLTGGLSLYYESGLLFKLKPALISLIMAGVFFGSVIAGKPLILAMLEQQLGEGKVPKTREAYTHGATIRFGLCFVIDALVTTLAALWLSTSAWAAVKGFGMLVILVGYAAFEVLFIKYIKAPQWKKTESSLKKKKTTTPPEK